MEVSYMAGLVKPLSDQNRCILLEQRGTGRSQITHTDENTFLLDTYVEDVEALRKSLHLGQLNILGHSWGGLLAMGYAAKYPDRVQSLILLSAPGMDAKAISILPGILQNRLSKEDIEAEQKWLSPEEQAKDAAHAGNMALEALMPAYFFDRQTAIAWAAKMQLKINPAIPAAVFGGLIRNSYDLRVRLTAYHGPTLIVQGDHDVVGNETAKDIGDTIYGSQVLYIPRCGHFEWVERPDILMPALEAFLAAYAAPPQWSEEDYPVGPPFFGGRHGHGHGHR